MKRRAFLATGLDPVRLPGRAGALSRGHARTESSSSRATTARIPSIGSNGGTSPAGSTARSASRSRSSARGRRRRATTRASSTRGRSCSRTPRFRIPKRGRLLHDQRAARAGFSLAHAELDRTGVWIDDWRLELEGHRYQARIAGARLRFRLHPVRQPARPAGRRRLQPQGPPAARGELLLQPPAPQRRRQAERQGRRRRGLARPRMVERLPGAGGLGLGLVRHQPAERRLADGVPDAQPSAAPPTTRRPAFRSSPCAPGNRRAPASNIRWRCRSTICAWCR